MRCSPLLRRVIQRAWYIMSSSIAGPIERTDDPASSYRIAAHGDCSFPRFGLLPPLIRLMIWQLNLPGPRLVKVRFLPTTGRFYTDTQLPTNLMVCRESRLEAMNKYSLHFGTLGHPPTIRIDMEVDTVQLDWMPIRLSMISHRDLSNVLYLGIGGRDFQSEMSMYLEHPLLPDPAETVVRRLATFPKLVTVSIASPSPAAYLAPAGSSRSDSSALSAYAHSLAFSLGQDLARQHQGSLARALRRWKKAHPEWAMPKLNLILVEIDNLRIGPFLWA